MPNITEPIFGAEQAHEQVKRRLELERSEHAKSAGGSFTTEGLEAHAQVDLPKQWAITTYVKKMWKGPWFGGVNVDKRF